MAEAPNPKSKNCERCDRLIAEAIKYGRTMEEALAQIHQMSSEDAWRERARKNKEHEISLQQTLIRHHLSMVETAQYILAELGCGRYLPRNTEGEIL